MGFPNIGMAISHSKSLKNIAGQFVNVSNPQPYETIYFNGKNWVNGSLFNFIQNTDNTIKITASSTGAVLSLNTGIQNVWTALQVFNAGISGNGNTGNLSAGTGILGGKNNWTALQTFKNGITVTNGITVDTESISGNLTVGGNLTVSGNTSLSSMSASSITGSSLTVPTASINNLSSSGTISANSVISNYATINNFVANVITGYLYVNPKLSGYYNNSPKNVVSQSLLSGVI